MCISLGTLGLYANRFSLEKGLFLEFTVLLILVFANHLKLTHLSGRPLYIKCSQGLRLIQFIVRRAH